MHLNHLKLLGFRNYVELALDLPTGPILVCGDNAQGKTNLLEAIYFLSTMRSSFARAERQLINWIALEHDLMPYARLEGQVQRKQDAIRIDVTLLPNEGGRVHKEMRLNGVKKRALDLVGQLNAVLFLPEDIGLVTGSPSERRRYLDVTLCQIKPAYCRALAGYNRILTQRNALLKQLAERNGDQDELLFWDEQLADLGSVLIRDRRQAILELDHLARERYHWLSDQQETLRLYYTPSFDPEHRPRLDTQRPVALEHMWTAEGEGLSQAEVAAAFLEALHQSRRQELARGLTLVGPHRDDLHFLVDGIDMTLYGSRGQQRSTALALKLAEADLMARVMGDPPVLLLDDVMSELDPSRRERVVSVVEGVEQAVLTATDWSAFSPALTKQSLRLAVSQGQISTA